MPILFIGAVMLVVGIVVVALSARRGDDSGTSIERSAGRHLRATRLVALVCGVAAFAGSVTFGGSLGRGLVVAPALAGAVATVVMAVGEMSAPREGAVERSASLARRNPSDFVSRAAATTMLVTLGALVGLLVLAGLTASADDMGRDGRAVEWATALGGEGRSPWPGAYYGVPLGVSLLVLCVGLLVGLRAAAARPQLNADHAEAVSDNALRHRSARSLQCIALLALGLSLAGVALLVTGGTRTTQPGAPTWVSVAHWCGVAGLLIALVACLVGVRTQLARAATR